MLKQLVDGLNGTKLGCRSVVALRMCFPEIEDPFKSLISTGDDNAWVYEVTKEGQRYFLNENIGLKISDFLHQNLECQLEDLFGEIEIFLDDREGGKVTFSLDIRDLIAETEKSSKLWKNQINDLGFLIERKIFDYFDC